MHSHFYHTIVANTNDTCYTCPVVTDVQSLWDYVCEDAAAIGSPIDRKLPLATRVVRVWKLMRYRPSFACVFWLRVNQLWALRVWRGSVRLRIWRQRRFASNISEYADIGPGLHLPQFIDITVCSQVVIGKNATITCGVGIGGNKGGEKMPHLGDNVTIHAGAKVIGDITIGDNSEIGSLVLCRQDVPPDSTVFFIPQNVTMKRKS